MATKKKTKTTNRSTKVKAKPAPKKRKTPVKKKAVKKIANPHVGKRFFRIELSGYGGELIVGRASEEFVQYWLDEDRKDSLMDHMHAMNDMAMYGDDFSDEDEEVERDEIEGFDKDSPEVYEGAGNQEYWNFDDIEHETMVSYEYVPYTVTEITVDPKAVYKDGELAWDDKETRKKNFDWSASMTKEIEGTSKEYQHENCVVSRELYIHNTKDSAFEVCDDEPVPAIMLYDSQKGVFGHLYVMTNGEDFDPKKFAYVALDNTMSSNAEMFYYDKVLLSVDTNELSTWGKGFFANVGYLPKCEVEYNFSEMLEEGWKNLEEV
jgi:hypothetical protein